MAALTSPTYLLAEHRLGSDLAELLAKWQRARVSAPAMARLLADLTEVEVSPETVRRWMRELRTTNGDPVAA